MALCKRCEFRVVLPAFANGRCRICHKEITSVNTPVDALCSDCAEKYGLCQHCANPLDDNKPIRPSDLL